MQQIPFNRSWRLSHSIWLVWLLFPFGFTSFISFIYIGIRVRKVKWIIAGVIYFIITAQYFIISDLYEIDHPVFSTSLLIAILAWIVAWSHAIAIRREYLRLLAQKVISWPDNMGHSPDTTFTNEIPAAPKSLKLEKADSEVEISPAIININEATVEQLRVLPSIDAISAMEMLRTRERVGGFESYTHLVSSMKVQPHVYAEAKPFIVFSNNELKRNDEQKSHANKEHAIKLRRGRIVDY